MRKPKFDPDLDLFSTEQLRERYRRPFGPDGVVTDRSEAYHDRIAAEIRWRVHREERRFWLLAVMTFVAALAGSVAAVFAALGYYGPR
jgi:hypothetical protein